MPIWLYFALIYLKSCKKIFVKWELPLFLRHYYEQQAAHPPPSYLPSGVGQVLFAQDKEYDKGLLSEPFFYV